MVSISYSGAEIYSIVIAGKYCQSYTDPGLNGAESKEIAQTLVLRAGSLTEPYSFTCFSTGTLLLTI